MVAAIGYDVQQISTGGQAGGRTRQKGNYHIFIYSALCIVFVMYWQVKSIHSVDRTDCTLAIRKSR